MNEATTTDRLDKSTGLGVYLAVSDADDDGNIIVDAPAVDVDIDE